MKTSIITLFIFILFSVSNQVFSQENFSILSISGKCQIERNGKWDEQITRHSKINSGDRIKLNKNSYLLLANSATKTIELKEPRIYNLKEISVNLKSDNSTIMTRLIKVVNDKISSSGDVLGRSERDMTEGGRTSRGIRSIDLKTPAKIYSFSTKQELKWEKQNGDPVYDIKIYDPANKLVFSKDLNKNTFQVDLQKMNLAKGVIYSWVVGCTVNHSMIESETGSFSFLTDSKITEIKSSIATIESQFPAKKSAIGKIYAATYLEENFVIREALKYYEQACKLQPKVSEYKNLLKAFRNKYSL